MNCSKCNAPIPTGEKTCPNCGQGVESSSVTTEIPVTNIPTPPPPSETPEQQEPAQTPKAENNKYKSVLTNKFLIGGAGGVIFLIIVFLLALKFDLLSIIKIGKQSTANLSSQKTSNSAVASPVSGGTGGLIDLNTTFPKEYREDTLTNFSKDELKKLAIIPLPDGFSVQEEYKGMKLVRTPSSNYTDAQLKLLHRFIDDTPKALLSPGPSAIVTFKKSELGAAGASTIFTTAFASGPYMFFDNDSFQGGGIPFTDKSVDRAFYAFIHELMHNYQFNEIADHINPVEIDKLSDSYKNWSELDLGAQLFDDFNKFAGYEKKVLRDGEVMYTMKYEMQKNQKTTEYGKGKIVEDMAETIAGAVTTDDSVFSQERLGWAYQLLGQNRESFQKNKFPYSAEIKNSTSLSTVYDNKKEEEMKSQYTLTDRAMFFAENKTADATKQSLQNDLTNRGWTGSFGAPTTKDGTVTIIGTFSVSGRDSYFELRNYDNSTKGKYDVLGTWVTVISGYAL